MKLRDKFKIANAYRNPATLSAYYLMNSLVLVAACAYALRGDWSAALSTILIFLLMFVPSIIKERYRLYLPFAIEFGIVFLFSLHSF